jgi:kynurenine formamidase
MDRDTTKPNGKLDRRTLIKYTSAAALGALTSKLSFAAEAKAASDSDLAKLRADLSLPGPGKEDRTCDPRDYFRTLSNWGRWGKDDVLGTLNLITPAIRASAATLVRAGITVGCGSILEPQPTNGYQRFMTALPSQPISGSEGNGQNLSAVAEHLSMNSHQGTHLDALTHAFWGGQMYNGYPSSSVTATDGATKATIAVAKDGIVSRGVMLDIPTSLGVEALDAGYGVTPEQLELAEKRQGVKVRIGDVVLMRTGYGRRVLEAGGYLLPSRGTPGWHPRCLPWLHERGVAAVGNDAAHDPFPTGFAWSGHYLPFHDVGIISMGLWLIDWCDLEGLAATCAKLGRFEFQVVVAPLRLQGCSGCPVNPIAIF